MNPPRHCGISRQIRKNVGKEKTTQWTHIKWENGSKSMVINAFPICPWCGRKEKVEKHQKAIPIVQIHRRTWLINIHQKHRLTLKFWSFSLKLTLGTARLSWNVLDECIIYSFYKNERKGNNFRWNQMRTGTIDSYGSSGRKREMLSVLQRYFRQLLRSGLHTTNLLYWLCWIGYIALSGG